MLKLIKRNYRLISIIILGLTFYFLSNHFGFADCEYDVIFWLIIMIIPFLIVFIANSIVKNVDIDITKTLEQKEITEIVRDDEKVKEIKSIIFGNISYFSFIFYLIGLILSIIGCNL